MGKQKKKLRSDRRRLDRQVNKVAKKIGKKLGLVLDNSQIYGIRCTIELKTRITFTSSRGIIIYNGSTDHISFGEVKKETREGRGGPV